MGCHVLFLGHKGGFNIGTKGYLYLQRQSLNIAGNSSDLRIEVGCLFACRVNQLGLLHVVVRRAQGLGLTVLS